MNLVKIKKISKTKSKTYDIEVEKNHNFFCNNHLIHNCSYRGEVGVVAINLEVLPFLTQCFNQATGRGGREAAMSSLFGAEGHKTFLPGDKVAQIIIEPCLGGAWEEVETLSETERAEKGYGSSGR